MRHHRKKRTANKQSQAFVKISSCREELIYLTGSTDDINTIVDKVKTSRVDSCCRLTINVTSNGNGDNLP